MCEGEDLDSNPIMRLVSVGIEGGDFEGRQTLRLEPVSALWGLNDAGKSTTLEAVGSLLSGAAERDIRITSVEINADDDEADELARRAAGDLGLDESYAFLIDSRWERLALDDVDRRIVDVVERAQGSGSALMAWLGLALGVLGSCDEAACTRLAEAAASDSRLVLVPGGGKTTDEAAYADDPIPESSYVRPGLDHGVDMGPGGEGPDPELLAAAPAPEDLEDRPEKEDPHGDVAWELWWTLPDGVDQDADLSRIVHTFQFSRRDWPSSGPLPLVPAASAPIGRAVLPAPIHVPLDWREVEVRLGDACLRLGKQAVRRADDEGWGRRAANKEAVRITADVAAARAIEALVSHAEKRMPRFITDQYKVSANYTENGDAALYATRRGGSQFPIVRLAQGFHLWVQLALVAVVDLASRCALEFPHIETFEEPGLRSMRDAALRELMDSTAEGARRGNFALWVEQVGLELLGPGPGLHPDSRERMVDLGARLFVIDEPEAHLHPAAQRQAAHWLATLVREDYGSCLIASHSPAFLSMGGPACLTHVNRAAGHRVQLRSLDPRDLAALDRDVSDLGFDRGELLALHRAVLFVEGATDQAVIEALYPDRIRDIGLLVQPFHGTGSHRRVLEVETLFRILGPPFHVLVDNVTEEERAFVGHLDEPGLEQLIGKPDRTKKRSDELIFLAHVRLAGLRAGPQLEIHAIPTKDILGALDDAVVRDLARERHPGRPSYPGFEAALAEAEERNEKYVLTLRRFGIEKNAEFFREAARRMNRDGCKSRDLDNVIDRITAEVID